MHELRHERAVMRAHRLGLAERRIDGERLLHLFLIGRLRRIQV